MNSIAKKDLLEQNPIIVNEKMEVIDGQHRLEASKQLHLPIYYLVAKTGNISDVQLLNGAVRDWKYEDYLNTYKASGLKDYFILHEFSNKYRIPIGVCLELLSGERTNKMDLIQDFKDGKFKVSTKDEADLIANELETVRRYVDSSQTKRDRELVNAVIYVHDKQPVGFLSFLEKLQTNLENNEKIKRQPSVRDYLREFEAVYNKHKSTNITRFF